MTYLKNLHCRHTFAVHSQTSPASSVTLITVVAFPFSSSSHEANNSAVDA